MSGRPSRQPTPKQVLLAHIAELHRKPPRQRMTLAELQKWHAHEHHYFHCSHIHAGLNLGPGARPPGWRTGTDVIRPVQTQPSPHEGETA